MSTFHNFQDLPDYLMDGEDAAMIEQIELLETNELIELVVTVALPGWFKYLANETLNRRYFLEHGLERPQLRQLARV